MASWMVHLRIADKLLHIWKDLSDTEFVVGNIAPDSGVPNADWSAYTPCKQVSHFQRVGEDGNKYICIEDFTDKYFSPQQRESYDKKAFSFYLGYLVHLLTDKAWHELVFYPTVRRDHKHYDADRMGAIWKWKADWYDLDFLYLREHPDFRAFAVYQNAVGFENVYMKEFARDAFDDRRRYIVQFYSEQREHLDRDYPWLNKEQMDAFTEEACRRIMASCKDVVVSHCRN